MKTTQPTLTETAATWSPLVAVFAPGTPLTGGYELRIGKLALRSSEWQKTEAEQEMPRIVACVNGCAGISDPETTVPELVAALKGLISAYKEAMDYEFGHHTEEQHEEQCPEYKAARAVIAKVP